MHSKPPEPKSGLHPRNVHRAGYDFAALIAALPRVASFVRPNPAGMDTIDFGDQAAVLALNQALLKHHYGIAHWGVPRGYLCPPIPGRADYLHHLADLLRDGVEEKIPRGASVRVLDIGTGANCIYPIVGTRVYGWKFVGSDIDPVAVAAARELVTTNPQLRGRVEIRLQPSPQKIFDGVVQPGETFAACVCNPPFHASLAEAAAGTRRKLKNLHGRTPKQNPALNFGGTSSELVCAGGEEGFIKRMIAESAERPRLCGWFTTLVSKGENLPAIERALRVVTPREFRTIDLSHGQKRSRIVAWRF